MTFYISALEILLLTYLLTPDLAAFQIFGLAFSLYSIIQLIRVCIDKPTTLGNRDVYEQNFSELISKQVRLVAGLRCFYTCGPTHGRLLCLCRN